MLKLTDQDSNLNRQNQNLQCYRYTIGQYFWFRVAKIKLFFFRSIIFYKIMPSHNINTTISLNVIIQVKCCILGVCE